MSNAGIQVADYLRRRREFETYTYRRGYDTLRGRVADRCRRREHQKRGFTHDHYNEFSEKCGLPVQHWILKRRVLKTRGRLHLWAGCLTSARRRHFKARPLQLQVSEQLVKDPPLTGRGETAAATSVGPEDLGASSTATGNNETPAPPTSFCRSVSRWCLRAGEHCRLPPHLDRKSVV